MSSKMLRVPCSYQGGKQRIAAQIVDHLIDAAPDSSSHFYDLCCGSGAVSIELVNRGIEPSRITMLDISSGVYFGLQLVPVHLIWMFLTSFCQNYRVINVIIRLTYHLYQSFQCVTMKRSYIHYFRPALLGENKFGEKVSVG